MAGGGIRPRPALATVAGRERGGVTMKIGKRTEHTATRTSAMEDDIRKRALPLSDPSDLDPLIERIGSARYVLLGEATHGTSEFYEWRAALSRRLIQERGFSF